MTDEELQEIKDYVKTTKAILGHRAPPHVAYPERLIAALEEARRERDELTKELVHYRRGEAAFNGLSVDERVEMIKIVNGLDAVIRERDELRSRSAQAEAVVEATARALDKFGNVKPGQGETISNALRGYFKVRA